MTRLETLAIFVGLLLALAFVAVRMDSVTEIDAAVAVFAMVAAWWGIAIGLWSDAPDDDAIGG